MTKKHLLSLALIVAVLLLWTVPVQAAENIQATLTANANELTVGDPVQLTLKVSHPAGTQVIVPRLEQTWGNFEVQHQSQTETVQNPDGSETTRQTLTVTLFEPGDFETPPLPLTITDNTGQVSEVATTPAGLTVVPVLAEGDTSLMDIRPQAGMDVASMWPAILAGLVIGLAMAGGGWWLYRRWRTGGFGVDNRPPFQVALDELAHIESLKLPEKDRFKTHYTLVTDCLRTYIEKQFQVHAFDRTTVELKQSLAQSTMPVEHTRLFIDLFKDSDLVKFAKLEPSVEEAYDLSTQARYLVEITRPVPEETEAAQQAVDPPQFQHSVEVAQ